MAEPPSGCSLGSSNEWWDHSYCCRPQTRHASLQLAWVQSLWDYSGWSHHTQPQLPLEWGPTPPPCSSQQHHPQGLAGTIGPLQVRWKAPQWALIVPWKLGKMLVWDATWPDTYAPSHLFCSCQRGGCRGSKSLASEECQVRWHDGQPSLYPFWCGNIRCAWADSTQPRLGHWPMPAPGNRGETQQGVPPPKNCHCGTDGECCSSAWDLGETRGTLLGLPEGAPSPHYYCF